MNIRWVFAGAVMLGCATHVVAQDMLIQHATVHTVAARGTLKDADVLVQGGKITAIGTGVAAPAGIAKLDAKGRPLTPGLFAGISGIGLEEVSLEPSTIDTSLAFGAQQPVAPAQWRPEFDVGPAYNARSVLVPIARVEGYTFTVLGPSSVAGGSLIAGQGEAVLLDGAFDAIQPASRTLFVSIGGAISPLSGGSRAGQYMLLEQALREARPLTDPRPGDAHLLTPTGREALARFMLGGRVAFNVDRAADIRQVLALSRRAGFKPIIVGGAEAWVVADDLARAKVPVLLDALAALPSTFDALGTRLDNAAKLNAAGVRIVFDRSGQDSSTNARKLRQLAGNAVAHGLPWDAALAALTANPADAFGLGTERGRIEVGLSADLVLWSGDPLEVTTWADQVWIAGRAMRMNSRQLELRDRYSSER